MLLVENQNVHSKKRNFTQHCQFHKIQPSQNFFDHLNIRSKLKPYEEPSENNLKIIVSDQKQIVEKEYRQMNQYLGEIYLQNKMSQQKRKKVKEEVNNKPYQIRENSQPMDIYKQGQQRQNNMDIEEYQSQQENQVKTLNQSQCDNQNSSQFDRDNNYNDFKQEVIANNIYEYYRQEKQILMNAIESRQMKMNIEFQ
ncbi:hypothetical protein TTHERM_00474500 (macronuclear) [Tetrahymena thermophila SB210]|uniref:Uncharacterized protein n=1 Tax=Tetrahymena thermophila (strain SB210) TaxID=312017 RepID=I7MHX0_TETTS|nr:hypothetical protein TTHERM_00474500 [Tetrahymena thermophila SB210]EAS03689.4 hypothetical protein TTHERM_00474500 [Tetrahymena thermophila SB210]|eukprot:XP_001023934.4 hypothetical protein TTHERM_00474500 [Tetrahymena thermophila SB210]